MEAMVSSNVIAIHEVAPLETLAARIQQEHEATVAAIKSGVKHAIAAGKLLLEAKAQLKHGRWLPWLKDHCKVPARTAQLYMWLAEHDPNAQRVADLPLRRAVLKLQQLDRDARRQAEREQVAQPEVTANVRRSENADDPEVSAKAMKARHAEADKDLGKPTIDLLIATREVVDRYGDEAAKQAFDEGLARLARQDDDDKSDNELSAQIIRKDASNREIAEAIINAVGIERAMDVALALPGLLRKWMRQQERRQ
jgi:Protein of unknown function (DUF3102)